MHLNILCYINKEKAITLETESSTSWLEQLKNYDFDVIISQTRANVKDNFSKTNDRQHSDRDYVAYDTTAILKESTICSPTNLLRKK